MSCRLLVVDDSPVMRFFIRRIVSISGFPAEAVEEAANGEEALRKLLNSRIDLVLTDINMPVMDGEQLIRTMKATPEISHIPVVVVTTDATENRIEELLGLGAHGYLTKPFPPERLSELLSMLSQAVL